MTHTLIRSPRGFRLAALLCFFACLSLSRAEVYVADNGIGGTGGVATFAAGANGNVLPDMSLLGANTGINNITSIAATRTALFVLCNDFTTPPYVLKYSLPTAGNATPVSKTFLAGAAGFYDFATALAVDDTNLYVLDNGSGIAPALGAVNVYPLSALTNNDSLNPVFAPRTITGSNTSLNRPTALVAVDGVIYVANTQDNDVLMFSTSASGNVAPTKSILGLDSPASVAVDGSTIYVLNVGNRTVTTYPTSTPGGFVTAATTVGSSAITLGAFYVGVDAQNLYIGDGGDFTGTPVPSVLVFPKATNNASATPSATISGPNALQAMNGLCVLPVPGTAAPTVTAGSGSTNFSIGGGAVVVDNAATLTAVPATLATATVQITGGLQATEDVLAFTNNNATTFGNIGGTYDSASGTLRLVSDNASATKAQWQAALRAVTYNDTAGSPNTDPRTVSTKVFDGAQASSLAAKTVTLTATPTITGVTAPANGSYVAGQSLTFSVTFSSAVTVTGTPQLNLTLGSTARAATFVSGSGSTTLTFSYSVALGDNDADGIALSSPLALNGGAITGSGSVAAALTFTPPTLTSVLVNTAASVATSGGTTAFTGANNAAATPVVVDGGLTVTDASSSTLVFAVVTISGNFEAGTDVLSFTNDGSTMGTISASDFGVGIFGSAALTLFPTSGTPTLAEWQAALRAVKFTSTSATPSTATRTISFRVNDGVQFSNTAVKSVSVTAVNQSPVVTTSGGTVNFISGGSPVAVDSGLTISDANNATLATASISITNPPAGDSLNFTPNAATMGNIAVLQAYSSLGGQLSLISTGATATLAQWQAALRAVTFSHSTTPPVTGSREITFYVNDGVDPSAAATRTLVVQPPVPAVASVTAPAAGSYYAGQTLTFSVVFNQPVTVTGTPQLSLTIGSVARNATYVSGSGTATLTFSYVVAYGDTAASGIAVASPIALNGGTIKVGSTNSGLTFTPPSTASVIVNTAPVLVASGGNTAFVSADNAPATPVAVDPGITLTHPSRDNWAPGTYLLVAIADNYQAGTDVLSLEADPATMGSVQAVFLSEAGFFPAGTLGIVNAGNTPVTSAQMQAALRAVKFTSTAPIPNTANRTITFQAYDDTQYSNTVSKTVTVTAVAQSPVVTPSSGSTVFFLGGNPVVIDAGAVVSDLDSSTLASVQVAIDSFQAGVEAVTFTPNAATMGNIAGSYITPGGVPTLLLSSAGATATLAQWQAALRAVLYQSTAASVGDRTVTFVANDGALSSVTASKTVALRFMPTIAWSPAGIVYGASLGSGQLNAAATYNGAPLAGSFVYTPPAGAVLAAGTQSLSVTFTPTDTATYGSLTSTSSLVVTPAPTTVAAASKSITFTGSSQTVPLTATVTSAAGTVNVGTVTFTLLDGQNATVGTPVTSGTVSSGSASASYAVPGTTGATTLTIKATYNAAGSFATSSDTSAKLSVGATSASLVASGFYNPDLAGVFLSAAVTSSSGTVSDGTVTFMLKTSGGAIIGTPVTVAVSGGAAFASYPTPSGDIGGTYTIEATYNPPVGGSFGAVTTRNATVVTSITTETSGELNLVPKVRAVTMATGLPAANHGQAHIAIDKDGNVYRSNYTQGTITKITSAGVVSEFVSGLVSPDRLACDTAGNLYVATNGNTVMRKITPAGAVSVLANLATQGSDMIDLKFDPAGVLSYTVIGAVKGSGNELGFNLFRISNTGALSNFQPELSGVTGLLHTNSFAWDASRNFYIVIQQGTYDLFRGNGINGNGTGNEKALRLSTGLPSDGTLVFDSAGNLFFADATLGTIEKIATDGSRSTYLATGKANGGVVADKFGYLYLPTGNDVIRVGAGGTATVTASVIVRTPGVTVTSGTVTFTLMDGTTVVGSPVTAPVVNGKAKTDYPIPVTTAGRALALKTTYAPAPASIFTSSASGNYSFQLDEPQRRQLLFGFFSGARASGAQRGREALSAPDTTLAVIINDGGSTGTLVGYLESIHAGFKADITIADDNTFTGQATTRTSTTGVGPTLTFQGSIADGVMRGTVPELGLSFTAQVETDTGASASQAGLYQASSLEEGDGATYSVVGTQGEVFVLALTPDGVGAGVGSIAGSGAYTVTTAQGHSIAGTVDPAHGTTSATIVSPTGETVSLSGLSATVPVTHRLANLSTLGMAGAGQTITQGFVLSGPKSILARAIGPGLAAFGISGVQSAPTLTLFDGSGQVVLSNTAWAGDSALADAFARVGAFSLDPASHDAAFVTTLPAGNYTLQVSGGTTTGWALAELYDLEPISAGSLGSMINMSTLGPVTGSSRTLVTGFVIGGNTPRTVLIRGVGPGLAPFGVSDALSTPLLHLYDGAQQLIAQNADWGTLSVIDASDNVTRPIPASSAEIAATASRVGAFSLAAGSKDSSLLVTLPPGNYSVHLSGQNNTHGTALIEIYEVR